MIESYDDVVARVDAQEGIALFELGELRRAEGWGRLSQGAAAAIRRSLEMRGLGWMPLDRLYDNYGDPMEQELKIRLYRRSTLLGQIMQVAEDRNPDEQGSRFLLDVVNDEAAEKLRAIRRIINDPEGPARPAKKRTKGSRRAASTT
jgi:hypothetical protein